MKPTNHTKLTNLILKTIALAMGIAVIVLTVMDNLEISTSVMLLGIGLTCLAMAQFEKNDANKEDSQNGES